MRKKVGYDPRTSKFRFLAPGGVGKSGQVWTPKKLSNLIGYGRAATAGNTTTQWNDETGNANHLTKTVGNTTAALTTDNYGLTSYVPPDVNTSTLCGWSVPAGLVTDRRNFTAFFICWPRSWVGSGWPVTMSLGATDHECLLDTDPNKMTFRCYGNDGDHLCTRNLQCVPIPIIISGTASGINLWVGSQTKQTMTAWPAGTSTGGTLYQRTGGYGFQGNMYEWGLMSAAISDADAAKIISYASSVYYPTTYTNQITWVGDSIPAGYNSANNYCYPNYLLRRLGNSWNQYASNVVASRASGQLSFVQNYLSKLPKQSGKNIAIIDIGTNDLGLDSATAATVLGNLQSLCTAFKSQGIKVIVATIAQRNDASWSGAKETQRQSLNLLISALSNTYADAIWDKSATMGTPDYTINNNFYTDNLHGTAAFQIVAANALLPIVNSL